ncbi:transposase domain-containing protein [Rhizophagus clarus]|uniref:Transposase domain-containing protein n=1 Tax=Rhizophagus clarus TaxID=94130 RepID=A0A8H3QVM9_9GLOM|nr:transposase domain-containing protein [Rhizophagus clarus]
MSNKNLELCECLRCKRNRIGKYVHPTTKWRHSKKRKYSIELIDDDIIDESYDEYNSYNEESYGEESSNKKSYNENEEYYNEEESESHNEEKSESYNEEESEFHNKEESFYNSNEEKSESYNEEESEFHNEEESFYNSNEEKSESYNEEESEFHNEEESFYNRKEADDWKETDDEEELIVSESENNSLNLEGSLKDRTLLENINLTTVEHNITNEVAKGLRLLEIKVQHNISNTAFKEIVTATVGISSKSTHSLIKMLKDIIPIKPIWVDRCINSCCAFTGDYENLNECIYCKAKRYQVKGQSRAQVAYFSIQDQLVIQYQDSARAKQLRYRSEYISRNIDGTIGDVFDGAQYKNLLQKGYFQDDRDIVLLGSVDGYQLFKQKCDDCWIILFINANLPPEQRVKKENLLITSIIPGPKAPKDFNSFLKPVVDELCLLEGGIDCYDGFTNEKFSLKATVLSWSGNTPDANNTNETYNPSNLPRRMHSDYVTRIGQIVTIEPSRTRELLASNLGVVGRSVLLDIRSTQFPACFPVDIVHLFYENVAPYMLRHWMGSFFKDSTLNNQPYTLSNKQWSEIGANMDAIKKSIPTEFGQPPQNIFRHYSGYKAEEWASWITLYSLPLLKDQLPSVYLKDNKAAEMKLSDFETRGIKFGRLITSDGQVIGSEWIRRNKDWARINYTVLTRMEVDRWAHIRNATPDRIYNKNILCSSELFSCIQI